MGGYDDKERSIPRKKEKSTHERKNNEERMGQALLQRVAHICLNYCTSAGQKEKGRKNTKKLLKNRRSLEDKWPFIFRSGDHLSFHPPPKLSRVQKKITVQKNGISSLR